jgi:TctA family transporter
VGLFAAAELFNLVGRDYVVDDLTRRSVSASRILIGMRDTFRYPGTLMTEGALLRTYQMSGGEIEFMLTRPIALGMLVLLVLSIILPYLGLSRSGLLAKP